MIVHKYRNSGPTIERDRSSSTLSEASLIDYPSSEVGEPEEPLAICERGGANFPGFFSCRVPSRGDNLEDLLVNKKRGEDS
mgnify:CR=1 FL=1